MGQPDSFLIVGGGKMGEAILKGWISSEVAPADAVSAENVTVVEPTAERGAFLHQEHGVTCVGNVADVAATPDVVVLAVKPQVMMSVLADLVKAPAFQDSAAAASPLFISIAAGLRTAVLEAALPSQTPLVRVMPNMPLAIGAGASGVCGGAAATQEQVQFVAQLFGCLGRAEIVDESDMDAVCAVSGSGPAYVIAMIESLRDAGVAEGLDPQVAETLALQTVLGTARLVAETGADLADTRVSICSPGGTTLAALDAMNTAGFDDVFAKGVHAAVVRGKELAESK